MLDKARVSLHSSAIPISEGILKPVQSREWFAVYTKSRHEKRVALHFQQREIAYFLPLYRAERTWKSSSPVELDLPLFPGYVFVNVGVRERVKALQVPGVVTMVAGGDGRPASIADEEIDALRAGLDERRAQPHPHLAAGQLVRIRSGALCGVEGRIVRLKNGFRVVLTLELIRQSFSVEVRSDELELLDHEARRDTSAA